MSLANKRDSRPCISRSLWLFVVSKDFLLFQNTVPTRWEIVKKWRWTRRILRMIHTVARTMKSAATQRLLFLCQAGLRGQKILALPTSSDDKKSEYSTNKRVASLGVSTTQTNRWVNTQSSEPWCIGAWKHSRKWVHLGKDATQWLISSKKSSRRLHNEVEQLLILVKRDTVFWHN